MKKTAVMIYRKFCMQEISCLTEWLGGSGKPMIVCAADRQPVKTEDGFTVLPDLSFDELNLDDIDCLILPGICEFPEVLSDCRIIDFLKKFTGHPEILIAAISIAPVLLGAAGLLKGRLYCGGFYQEVLDSLPFLKKENFRPVPLIEQDHIITAFGGAYREFAIQVSHRLGLNCPADVFGPLAADWPSESLIFTMESKAEQDYWETALQRLKTECPHLFK